MKNSESEREILRKSGQKEMIATRNDSNYNRNCEIKQIINSRSQNGKKMADSKSSRDVS